MLTPSQLFEVQADGRFDAVLERDPVLSALEAEKYDRSAEYAALTAVLGGRFSISGSDVDFAPLTPAVWSVLWMIGSPFTTRKPAAELDADIVLYLLHVGINAMPEPADLPEAAAGFIRRNSIDPADAILSIRQMVDTAFRPLEMLPPSGTETGEVRFDADWLTRLAATVCRETNFDADHVIFDLPLTSCCYYCVQAARRNGGKHRICRRSNDELCREIYRRTLELAENFYRETLHHADDSRTEA